MKYAIALTIMFLAGSILGVQSAMAKSQSEMIHELCTGLGEVGTVIMGSRQSGLPESVTMNIMESQIDAIEMPAELAALVLQMVIAAYALPQQEGEAKRQRATERYSEDVQTMCLSSYGL